MFPTHVGMNRTLDFGAYAEMNVPHTRGDEPKRVQRFVVYAVMFPTHVGMNRCVCCRS